MKNCGGSPEQLRESIMSTIRYSNKVNSKCFREQHLFLE